jgi:hypothetical protein
MPQAANTNSATIVSKGRPVGMVKTIANMLPAPGGHFGRHLAPSPRHLCYTAARNLLSSFPKTESRAAQFGRSEVTHQTSEGSSQTSMWSGAMRNREPGGRARYSAISGTRSTK